MSQWRNGLAHWTSNSKVVGSSPTWDDIFGWFSKLFSFVFSKVVLYLFCLLLITPSFARLRVMFTVPHCVIFQDLASCLHSRWEEDQVR